MGAVYLRREVSIEWDGCAQRDAHGWGQFISERDAMKGIHEDTCPVVGRMFIVLLCIGLLTPTGVTLELIDRHADGKLMLGGVHARTHLLHSSSNGEVLLEDAWVDRVGRYSIKVSAGASARSVTASRSNPAILAPRNPRFISIA